MTRSAGKPTARQARAVLGLGRYIWIGFADRTKYANVVATYGDLREAREFRQREEVVRGPYRLAGAAMPAAMVRALGGGVWIGFSSDGCEILGSYLRPAEVREARARGEIVSGPWIRL